MFDAHLPGAITRKPWSRWISGQWSNLKEYGLDYALKSGSARIKRISQECRAIFFRRPKGHFERLELQYRSALSRYTPKKYPGHVVMFLAAGPGDLLIDPKLVDVDPHRGWGPLLALEPEIHEVPGGHIDMLSEPHVQMVADRLQSCLDQLHD
jgi:hypothetical protein